MRTISRRARQMIGGLIVLVAFVASMPAKGSAQEGSQTVFGEVDSKTDQIIVLNVTPCQDTKTLERISPYKITGSGKVSCSGGRKQYTRVTVQKSKPVEDTGDKKREDTGDKKKDGDAKPQPEH